MAIEPRARPAIVHTHMAKAGLIGRCAAALYNLDARRVRTRARVVHTYHGHVLEGYFSAADDAALFITLERMLARVTDRIVAISPAIRRELLDGYRIGRGRAIPRRAAGIRPRRRSPPSTMRRARSARQRLGIAGRRARRSRTVGRLTAIKQHRAVPRHVRARRRTRPHARRADRRRRRTASRPRGLRRAARHRRSRPLSRLAARSGDHLRGHRCLPADVAQRRHAGRADRGDGVAAFPASAPMSAASRT